MSSLLQQVESGLFGRLRRKPPTGVLQRTTFWLLILFLAFLIGSTIPGGVGTFFAVLKWLTAFPLIVCGSIFISRWLFRRALWNVRNRLIVTYLLMGLAPVVLFVTLAAVASYVFCGQFATFAATSAFSKELSDLAAQNRAFAMHIAHTLEGQPNARAIDLPDYTQAARASDHQQLQVFAFEGNKKLRLAEGEDGPANIDTVPPWAANGYQGVVLHAGRLYLRAVDRQEAGSRTATVVSSLPLGRAVMDHLAEGLGTVRIYPNTQFGADVAAAGNTDTPSETSGAATAVPGTRKPAAPKPADPDPVRLESVEGGKLPAAKHFYDVLVGFGAPLHMLDWQNGEAHTITLVVTSRPTLLYDRLFTTSLTIGAALQKILIGIALFFGFLELIAFLMAVRLNTTITQSVHDLYGATLQIDSGHLEHRIRVRRRDQLGALSEAFNKMAASLQRLLAEQREKQRLQSELAIAQEVQENLFPRGDVSVPGLELHGVCRPARTVSGDYYDFLLFGDTRLLLALGDISGKGISAALLMATLHSAVRAYRFAGEEFEKPGVLALHGGAGSRFQEDDEECGSFFESPAKMLEVLNRHLYRSTQPEKYATLFLAQYDSVDGALTYSNGGQLPPLVLCHDGSVKRLDCGGSVVGLLDGMVYEQGRVRLRSGDLVIAYSDGVTEPENEFGDFGEERLLEVVRRNRHLSLAAISDQVMQSLRTWIGDQEQPDDITLVLARKV